MSAKRRATVVGDVVHIPLTQGKTAIVDLIDADLGELNWYAKQGHGTCAEAYRTAARQMHGSFSRTT